jgi:hypothetical protein
MNEIEFDEAADAFTRDGVYRIDAGSNGISDFVDVTIVREVNQMKTFKIQGLARAARVLAQDDTLDAKTIAERAFMSEWTAARCLEAWREMIRGVGRGRPAA